MHLATMAYRKQPLLCAHRLLPKLMLSMSTVLPAGPVEKLRIVVSRAFVLATLVLILVSRSGWTDLVADLLFLVGLAFAATAMAGRLWCNAYIAGRKTTSLVTCGPYGLCRNPLYFFSFVGAVGVGLASGMVTVATVLAVGFALYYPAVIKSEEHRLKALHGDAYREYCAVTPAFFPLGRLGQEPASYSIDTRLFRSHVRDALWFIWGAALLKLVEELHSAEIIPYCLQLL